MSAPFVPSRGGHKLARVALAALAWFHPVALVACVLALRFIGEASWPTTVLLYVPRRDFAAALPFLVIVVCLVRAWRLLAPQAIAVGILLVPLAGFTWSCPEAADPGPALRILSYNAGFGHPEESAICREVEANDPHLVVLQAYSTLLAPSLERCLAGYALRVSGEFAIASRFPIRHVATPARLASGDRAGFVAYTVDTPLGPIELFNVHPISPRDGFEGFEGATDSQRHAPPLYERIFSADAHAHIVANTDLRRRQVEALAASMRRATKPVVVAGDTNLPGLSRLFAEQLGGLQDGFARAGRGFGYTFPPERPWMRIDRILAGPEFRFTAFHVGDQSRTTHLCVVAELQRRDARP